MSEYHTSVLLDESVSALVDSIDGVYADVQISGLLQLSDDDESGDDEFFLSEEDDDLEEEIVFLEEEDSFDEDMILLEDVEQFDEDAEDDVELPLEQDEELPSEQAPVEQTHAIHK